MSASISRRRSFQCLHPNGQMLTPKGSAHNYYVEVTLTGELNSESGMIMNIRDVDGLIDLALRRVPNSFSTSEELALRLFNILHQTSLPPGVELQRLRLIESPDFWVDIWP